MGHAGGGSGAAGRRLWCLIIWCFQIAHTPTHNHGSKIRLAVISGFGKTEASLPDDEMLEHVRRRDLWLDWSDQLRVAGDDRGGRPRL